MTLNDKLIAALEPLGIPVSPDVYLGDEHEFIAFNFDLLPFRFADNRPTLQKALVQVHYYCPMKNNSMNMRLRIRKNLVDGGFTWPEEINATTAQKNIDGIQHFVFECESIEPIERIEEYEY